jgi:hypothetical protein
MSDRSKWLSGRGTVVLYVIVAAMVWLSASSGLHSFMTHLNGDATRAQQIAVTACSGQAFYNTHKSDCDALLAGQSDATAEGK